jgi:hypothetical protein
MFTPAPPSVIDVRRLRAVLAYRFISGRAFAAACRLSPAYLSNLLHEFRRIGPHSERALLRGLAAYGIELSEVRRHG